MHNIDTCIDLKTLGLDGDMIERLKKKLKNKFVEDLKNVYDRSKGGLKSERISNGKIQRR
jgi:hypothetical protein